jgi:anti-sigma factor RsiW
MTCEQAKTSLLDYLMEEATPAERMEIRQHVDSCAACASEMARLKQTMTLLVRAEVPEEIPQRIRLVPEPVSVWTQFWRGGARLAFASAGLACLAIGVLALSQASISYNPGGWQIAFGSASRAQVGSGGAVPAIETAVPLGALDRAEVMRMIAEAVAASEVLQLQTTANLIQQAELQRARDLQELSESFRYIQAAQTMMWKDQVQSQEVVGVLARQAGLPLTRP